MIPCVLITRSYERAKGQVTTSEVPEQGLPERPREPSVLPVVALVGTKVLTVVTG